MNWRNYVSCFEGEDKAGKRLLNRYLIISGVCVCVGGSWALQLAVPGLCVRVSLAFCLPDTMILCQLAMARAASALNPVLAESIPVGAGVVCCIAVARCQTSRRPPARVKLRTL